MARLMKASCAPCVLLRLHHWCSEVCCVCAPALRVWEKVLLVRTLKHGPKSLRKCGITLVGRPVTVPCAWDSALRSALLHPVRLRHCQGHAWRSCPSQRGEFPTRGACCLFFFVWQAYDHGMERVEEMPWDPEGVVRFLTNCF